MFMFHTGAQRNTCATLINQKLISFFFDQPGDEPRHFSVPVFFAHWSHFSILLS